MFDHPGAIQVPTGTPKWPKTAPNWPRMAQNHQNGSKWHCQTPNGPNGPNEPKTRNQMRVVTQSGCVPKILALQRWSKIDFPPEFQTRQMHSFLIMYNTMGSKVDGLAVRDHFLQKKWPKNSYFGVHNSGSTDFRGGWDPNFSRYR